MNRRWLFLVAILAAITLYNTIGYHYFDGVCWLAGRGVTGGVWSQNHVNWALTLFHSGVVIAVVLLAVGFFASLGLTPGQDQGAEGECPRCSRSVSAGWKLCPYCGLDALGLSR